MKYGDGFWVVDPDSGLRFNSRFDAYPETRGFEYADGTGDKGDFLLQTFCADYTDPETGLVYRIRITGCRRPLLFVNAFDFEDRLEPEFGQKPGRHADWREFLLVYRELGDGWFTPERREVLERFAAEHDFRHPGLPSVLGVPMELRSVDGVQGEPWPRVGEGLAEQAERLWQCLAGWLEERVVRALDDFDRDYARREAGAP